VTVDPGGPLAWLIVGLIAGWLTGQLMTGAGYVVVGSWHRRRRCRRVSVQPICCPGAAG
jgi:hypothetical protein